MGVVVKPAKIRIIHDLTFLSSTYAGSVKADTAVGSAPDVELGRVLRDVIWRILFWRAKFGPSARIVMSKIDLTDAFRNVPVRPEKSAVFGYAFGEWVVIDGRLEFGWTNSPGYFCLLTGALEHSHAATTFADAVVTEQGRAATAHINVQPPLRA